MKNKKLWLKLLLDLVMLVVLVLLLRKDNFGIKFHEIAGLSLLGVILLHIILNWRWVIKVTSCLFSKNINIRTKIGYLVNLGLLVCFIIIGISGIFISHVLFQFSVDGNWKTPHYFCTALAIILVGIHLGLHLNMIKNTIGKHIHINRILVKTITCCFACAVIVIGLYSIPTTSFSRWIVMPFQTVSRTENKERSDFKEKPQYIENSENSSLTDKTTQESNPDKGSRQSETTDINTSKDKPDNTRTGINIGSVISKSVQYASICVLIAIFTWGIEYLLNIRYNKKCKKLQKQIN